MTGSDLEIDTSRTTLDDMVRRASEGCRVALGELLESFEPLLSRLARERLGPRRYLREREDVLQQLKLAIVTAASQFRGTDSPSFIAWTRRVAESRLVDWNRRENALRRAPGVTVLDLGPGAPDPRDSAPGPAQIASRQEELDRVCEAIERVPLRYRPVLEFVRRSSPTLPTIAEFLGKDRDAARKFVARAMVHLRHELTTNETVRIDPAFRP